MSQILFFSDVHAFRHKQMPSRQDDCLRCLRWAFETARARGIKQVVFAGDMFHEKVKIHVLVYQLVYEILEEFNDLEIFLLVGNHDMWYVDSCEVTSIRPFDALRHVRVIWRPETVDVGEFPIDFAPYSRDPIGMLTELSVTGKKKLLVGHLAVDGAVLNAIRGTYSEVEVENDSDMITVSTQFFRAWPLVLLGHYHGHQIMDGFVEYIGSPLELSWNEVGKEKHLVILDTKTLKREYVVNTFSPRHVEIYSDQIGKVDLNNCFVRVNVPSVDKAEIMEMKAEIVGQYKVLDLDFREPRALTSEIDETAQQKFDLSKGDIYRRFVDAVGTDGLEKDLILAIVDSIVSTETH